MIKASVLPALIVATLTLWGACADAKAESQDAEVETLGSVNFPTSCNEEVAEIFTRGVAFLHSMEYPEARAEFAQMACHKPQRQSLIAGLVQLTKYDNIVTLNNIRQIKIEFTIGKMPAFQSQQPGFCTCLAELLRQRLRQRLMPVKAEEMCCHNISACRFIIRKPVNAEALRLLCFFKPFALRCG